MAKQKIGERWWGRTLFGFLALIFGLTFLFVPGIGLTVFLVIFGIFMLIAGFVLLGFSRLRRPGLRKRLNQSEGVIDIIIGIVAIFLPGTSSTVAVFIVGVFAILAGILQIFEGVAAERRERTFGASNRWLLFIAGIWALLIGVLLIAFQGSGIFALLWLIGIFLVILGS